MDAPETNVEREPRSPSRLSRGLAWAVSIVFGVMNPVILLAYFGLAGGGYLPISTHLAPLVNILLFFVLTAVAAGIAGCFWKGPARELGRIGTIPCPIYLLNYAVVGPVIIIITMMIALVTFGAYYASARFFQMKTEGV